MQPTGPRYAMRRTTHLGVEEAEARMRAALKTEGFGVLTEIDIRATMREKLGVDISPYRILGACNPPLALQALSAEPDVGLLLPCNVVIREDQEGRTVVEAIDPLVQFEAASSEPLRNLATQVRARLSRALEAAVRD